MEDNDDGVVGPLCYEGETAPLELLDIGLVLKWEDDLERVIKLGHCGRKVIITDGMIVMDSWKERISIGR